MSPRYEATVAALDHYDRVDLPAVEALCRQAAAPLDVFKIDEAKRRAANRVRAAFLQDMRGVNTADQVDTLNVEVIRRMIGGTFLGRLLGRLP